eukprot:4262399-Alexandrium_andersonii.AAC.1
MSHTSPVRSLFAMHFEVWPLTSAAFFGQSSMVCPGRWQYLHNRVGAPVGTFSLDPAPRARKQS